VKSISEVTSFLNDIITGESKEIRKLRAGLKKGYITQKMFDNSYNRYKDYRTEMVGQIGDMKSGNVSYGAVYSRWNKIFPQYAGGSKKKKKEGVSWMGAVKAARYGDKSKARKLRELREQEILKKRNKGGTI